MSKFAKNDWVVEINSSNGNNISNLRGIVRGNLGQKTRVLFVGKNKTQLVLSRNLKTSSPPQGFVLEGNLDDKLTSSRSEEHLLRTWFNSINVPIVYKNIHNLEDIILLTQKIKSSQHIPPLVHISCHGYNDLDGRAFIILAPGKNIKNRIYLNTPETQEVFRKAFKNLPLLFSACLLGKYGKEMSDFKKATQVLSIAAFTREVYDSESMIFELLVYHGIFIKGWSFRYAIEKSCTSMKTLGVRGTKGNDFVRIF